MKVTEYQQGIPSWFELETTDEAAAAPFYGALFGWHDDPNSTGDPNGAMYHMQLIDGDSVAAIFKQDPENSSLGIPPHWNTYITVKDLDAIAAKVRALGGAILAEPFDVMDVGRMAMITDPTGAPAALWQARNHIGSQRILEPNTPTWAELATDDPERASAFFRDLSAFASKPCPWARSSHPTGCSWLVTNAAPASSRSPLIWARPPTCGWSTSRLRTSTPPPQKPVPLAEPSLTSRGTSPALPASPSSRTLRALSSAFISPQPPKEPATGEIETDVTVGDASITTHRHLIHDGSSCNVVKGRCLSGTYCRLEIEIKHRLERRGIPA